MREAFLSGSVAPASDSDVTPADINLTKIKLENGGLYVEYTTGEADGHAECTARHKRPVHPDMLTAFARLVPHLCLLCDLVQGVQVDDVYIPGEQLFSMYPFEPNDPPLHERREFLSFKVTGLTFSTTGVVLIGQKRYRRGKKVLNLISPHEVLDPDPLTGDEYEHLWELRGELGRLEAEAHLYLGGKTGALVEQGELDFEGDDQAEGSSKPRKPSKKTAEVAKEVQKFIDFVDDLEKTKGYTVTVGRGADAHELGKGKKSGKDAAAGSDN